jgi:hypothetical protein
MLTQARSDLQNAEVAFGEIGDVAQGATTTDVELLRVAARLKSARGLMAYAETLAKFRRREAHTWDGAYAALKQAVEAWNALRSGPATESAASAGSDIARAIEGELSAEARNLLVGANLQVLRKAGSRANWNQLVNEIPKLLNVNLPDDRKYLDAWESNKANIPAPAN